MSCFGGNQTSTQQVTIPPDVLARYNAVNANAQQVASTPFQQYSTDPAAFVAQLNGTQQSGIAGTNAAAGQAQPYFDAATGQLINAQGQTQPYFSGATGQLLGGEGAALQNYGLAAGNYGTAGGAFGNQQTAGLNFNDAATQEAWNAGAQGQPYLQAAGGDLTRGQQQGQQYAGLSAGSLDAANRSALPLTNEAQANIAQGLAAAQPYNAQALGQVYGGLAGADPLNRAANQNITTAQAGAQPYQGLATSYAQLGARAVDPSQLTSGAINQYLSPYLSTVLGSTSALLNQQNQQALSDQLGNSIQQGAFGGDRAGIAAANLAQQQQLASASILSGIANQGYGQALATAQQQQGLGLSAGQANRAAIQQTAPELASIGQQGFGQGITTAQQQAALGQNIFGQGLGAGSALQGLGSTVYGQNTGTGQAQAALGQQLFGQGLATSQQQAALSNLLFGQGLQSSQQQGALGQEQYGQTMGVSQQLADLGQQRSGLFSSVGQNLQGLGQSQQGLGQAQFGTGAAAAQGLQNIGQGIYSTGANTAAQLAGLGTGAQGAALQGAQAQLAAGQVGQQTEQAGKTALYNQFLQQQSYPFQVAQFLANIAEGTGALSGSTTTTTSPAGIFSDKRLKADARPVGKTFDGQPIYSFRYKGDPRTMIGLMAQDVEKTHPEAVGEAKGFKTVDYAKATDKAAQRGHFAAGGVAGFDPDLAQQMLANGRGMFGPYLAAGSGPYGGAGGRVPMANLPVGELKTAGAPPPVKSAIEQAKQIADIGTSATKAWDSGEKGLDWLSSKLNPDEPPYARGGYIRRAMGGDTPYAGQEGPLSLDIPDESPKASLPPPGQPPPKSRSGLDDIADIAKIAAAIAAMRRGRAVRRGYADGGAPDADSVDAAFQQLIANDQPAGLAAGQPKPDFDAAVAQTLGFEGGKNRAEGSNMGISPAAHPGLDVDKLSPAQVKQIYHDQYWTPIGADKMSPDLAPVAFDTAVNLGVGRTRQMLAQAGNDPGKLLDLRQAHYDRLAKADPDKFGPYREGWANRVDALRGNLAPPVANDNSGLASGAPPAAIAAPAPSGVAAASPPPDASAAGLAAPAPAPSTTPAPEKPSWWQTATKRQNLVPLLEFLGTAASTPTHNLGVALGAGAVSAAHGIEGQQQIAINQQRTNAEVAARVWQIANQRFMKVGPNQWRDTVGGGFLSDAQHAQALLGLAGMTGILSAPQTGAAGPEASTPAEQPPANTPPVPQVSNGAADTTIKPPPQTPTEAIYAKYDKNPRVAALRAQADELTQQAEDAARKAQDPSIIGTPVASQYGERASTYRTQAQQAITQWQALREQYAEPEIATLGKSMEARFARQNETQQETFENAKAAQQTISQADAILANLKDPKTGKYTISGGPLGATLGTIAQLASQVNVPDSIVQRVLHTDPNDTAAVEKLRTSLGTEAAKQALAGTGGRLAQQEWATFLRTTPGAELPAAVSDWILNHVIKPRAQQQVDLYKQVRDMDPLHENVQKVVFDFQQAHPWWNPKAGSAADAAAAAGAPHGPPPKNAQGVLMPSAISDMAGVKAGTPFVVPDGELKGHVKKWVP